jgi:hypothetical protein
VSRQVAPALVHQLVADVAQSFFRIYGKEIARHLDGVTGRSFRWWRRRVVVLQNDGVKRSRAFACSKHR